MVERATEKTGRWNVQSSPSHRRHRRRRRRPFDGALSAAVGPRCDHHRSPAAAGRSVLRQCRHDQRRHLRADRPAGHAAQGALVADRSAGAARRAAIVFPEGVAVADALDRGQPHAARAGNLGRHARAAQGCLPVLEGNAGPTEFRRSRASRRAGPCLGNRCRDAGRRPGAPVEGKAGHREPSAHFRRPAPDVPRHLHGGAARRAGSRQRLHREPAADRPDASSAVPGSRRSRRPRERHEDHAARGRRLRPHDECRLPHGPADRRRRRRVVGRGSSNRWA